MKVFSIKLLQAFALIVLAVVTFFGVGVLFGERSVHALPEYTERTGESCGVCHVSPGGGGPRTLQGLLWAAQGKPDEIPQLGNLLVAPGVSDGVELYDIACAGCHGLSGEGLFGPALSDTNLTEEKIRNVTLRGWERNGMPAYEGLFTDEQLGTLVEYIAGISSGSIEPSPETYPLDPPKFGCVENSATERCGGN